MSVLRRCIPSLSLGVALCSLAAVLRADTGGPAMDFTLAVSVPASVQAAAEVTVPIAVSRLNGHARPIAVHVEPNAVGITGGADIASTATSGGLVLHIPYAFAGTYAVPVVATDGVLSHPLSFDLAVTVAPVPDLKLNPLPASVLLNPDRFTITRVGTTPARDGIPFAGRGDLNGDGAEDLVLAGWNVGSDPSPGASNPPVPVYLLLSTPTGYVLRQGKDLGIDTVPGATCIYVTDFTGDGRADIFFAGFNDNPGHAVSSVMAAQKPDGSFDIQFTAEKTCSHNGDAVDFNGDGRPDIILANWAVPQEGGTPGELYWESTGTGLKLHKFPPLEANFIQGMAATAGNYNRDGIPHIISLDVPWVFGEPLIQDGIETYDYRFDQSQNFTNLSYRKLPTPFFDADPRFAAAPSNMKPGKSHDICARTVDLDGDGYPDVIYASMIWASAAEKYQDHSIINILRNTPDGFVAETEKRLWNYQVTTREPHHTLNVVDVNGDGRPDVIGNDIYWGFLNSQDKFEFIPRSGGNELLVNDGDGHLVSVLWEGFDQICRRIYAQFPDIKGTNETGYEFFPFLGPHGEMRWLAFQGYFGGGADPHYYTAWFVVDAGRLSTGPGLTDPSVQGAPGYNEAFYLVHYPDVRDLVARGIYPSGLAHYLAVGRSEGRKANANAPPRRRTVRR